MISKELLTVIRKDEHKVLNTDFNYIEEDNKIGYFLDNRHWYFINIYELAYLCKEWASKHHYSVMSGREMTHWGGAYRVAVFRNSDNILFSMSTVKTEPEAIFRACEWILEQVTKK